MTNEDLNISIGCEIEFDERPCDNEGEPLAESFGTVRSIDLSGNRVVVDVLGKNGAKGKKFVVIFELDGEYWDIGPDGSIRSGQGFKKYSSFVS